MTAPSRISAKDASERLKTEAPPLLVCGYDEEKAFLNARLPGAISFANFREHQATLPRTRELIFYCG